MKIDKQIKDIGIVPLGIETAITSSLINMCAHYRNFFINTYGVETYFFLIGNSKNTYVENKICAEYQHPVPTVISTETIKFSVFNVLSTLVPYIPDVHLLNACYDFNAGVMNVMNATVNDRTIPCMAISKDPCSFILGAYGVYILRPKKYQKEDTSYIVLPENSIVEYGSYYNGRKITGALESINGLYETHVYATLLGCRARNLSKLANSLYGIYACFVKDKVLANSPFISEKDIESIARDYCHLNEADVYKAIQRIKVLDCNNISYIMYSTGDYSNGLILSLIHI